MSRQFSSSARTEFWKEFLRDFPDDMEICLENVMEDSPGLLTDIAAAVNDRTLGLHTWSDPRKVGPYNPRAWVWKAGRIAHRPDFTPTESTTEAAITPAAARQIGEFVLSHFR